MNVNGGSKNRDSTALHEMKIKSIKHNKTTRTEPER